MRYRDAYQLGASQNLAYNTSGGTAVSTTGFGNQTYWVQLCAPGAFTSTGGVRVAIGKGPAATSSSTFLPLNWVQIYRVGLGEQISYSVMTAWPGRRT